MDGKIHAEYARFRGRGSLEDVVTELERQIQSASDFVADTRDMEFCFDPNGHLALRPRSDSLRDFLPQDGIPFLDQALCQVANKSPIKSEGKSQQRTGIPTRFFRASLNQHPARTLDYLNGIMHDQGARRLVRVLDGRVRAFLSDQYRVIDTLQVAKQALQIVRDREQIEEVRTSGPSSDWYAGGLGDQKYLSRVAARSMGDLSTLKNKMEDQGGQNTIWPVATLKNSETGHGGLEFRGGILRGVCFNLATIEKIMREVHLGSRIETGIYARETIESEAETIFLKLRDNLKTWFTQEKFSALCEKIQGSAERKIERPSAATNLLVAASDDLSEDDSESILDHFMGGTVSRDHYGLSQAVARYAQDQEDAGRAEDLENLAGQIMTGKFQKALAEVTS